jgi:glycine dehydrogenase
LAKDSGLITIASIEPILLSNNGLVPPSDFNQTGCDVIVGDAHQFCFNENFGGPGLGIFGIRFNEKNKSMIRQAPGRFIGHGKDVNDREAKTIILSTREQHIRREKATSNICSNQSFMATLAGSNLLALGTEGLTEIFQASQNSILYLIDHLTNFKGVELAFAHTPFVHEVCFKLPSDLDQNKFLNAFYEQNIEPGMFIHSQLNCNSPILKIFTSDRKTTEQLDQYINIFAQFFSKETRDDIDIPAIPENFLRSQAIDIPHYTKEEVINYYQKLGDLNITPDDAPYPLGSCTMKYNPEVNDQAAALDGFTNTHPQSAPQFVQGNLELLYQIQEMFKSITGLPAVTTQPLAGAQGELVGLKMFQAYHRDRGEEQQRNIILIPRSAHGTNPATATVAGYTTYSKDGMEYGIVTLEAGQNAMIDTDHFNQCIKTYGHRIAGIMITNPNTCGIFEKDFAKIADKIHQIGGLVYMDGANMNAIAGWVNLNQLGVDAVHNNLHKTWTIPHGGGGPGDAIVAVSDRLIDYLPGFQVEKNNQEFNLVKPKKSIGSIHRHFGNFAHKIRCYTYIKALGDEGIRQMSALAVLSARYLKSILEKHFPILPFSSDESIRMHEFILTLPEEVFHNIQEKTGISKTQAITKFGKLFLDFGFHPPTVAFPEALGLMLEPTESYCKDEMDVFADKVIQMGRLIKDHPEVLKTAPHFTPVNKIDEVAANRNITFGKQLKELPKLYTDQVAPEKLRSLDYETIKDLILNAHIKLNQ